MPILIKSFQTYKEIWIDQQNQEKKMYIRKRPTGDPVISIIRLFNNSD